MGNIHLMNTLPCHLDVEIKSGLYVDNFEVNATLNHILYDLQPGTYDLVTTPSSPLFFLIILYCLKDFVLRVWVVYKLVYFIFDDADMYNLATESRI